MILHSSEKFLVKSEKKREEKEQYGFGKKMMLKTVWLQLHKYYQKEEHMKKKEHIMI